MDRALQLLRLTSILHPPHDAALHSVSPGNTKMAYSTLCLILLILFLQLLKTAEGFNDPVSANKTLCPGDCLCNWETLTADCSYSNLTVIPENLPHGIRHLNMSNNRIRNTIAKRIGLLDGEHSNLPIENTTSVYFNYLSNETTGFPELRTLKSVDLSGNGINTDLSTILHLLPTNLKQLVLAKNKISTFGEFTSYNGNQSFSQLEQLDLRYNHISSIPAVFFINCPQLKELKADSNALKTFGGVEFSLLNINQISLRALSLSHNLISYIHPASTVHFPNLEKLDLSYNKLVYIDGIWNVHCSKLTKLSLSWNPITYIPNHAFVSCKLLERLDLSGLSSLTYLNRLSLNGLGNLTLLNMSNSNLELVHPKAFYLLSKLKMLDLSYNRMTALYDNTFRSFNIIDIILNVSGNPWSCNCDLTWLTNYTNHITDNFICASPSNLSGLTLDKISASDLICQPAEIVNYTETALFKIGSSATLDCHVTGSPAAEIEWIIPNKQTFAYHPEMLDYNSIAPGLHGYHSDHHWHQLESYAWEQEDERRRIHILPNGSLFIDYVTRRDAGPYTCLVRNEYGNDSVVVHFRLDYQILFENTLWSVFFGVICATCLLLIGLGIGVVRIINNRCSKSEKEKRKGITQVLQNITDYKSAKFDKISAFKSAKMDQLSAFKNAKVGKMRTYKQATVQSVLVHMQTLREHYTAQIDRVKDNCSTQVEKLRDSYTFQSDKFRDYKTTKVGILKERYKFEKMDKLKDHYNSQALKIREYGSQQMTKLREQYKSQHQHLLKLLELLDVGNCMSAIEAECMRTESMIFNDNLMNLDIDTQPVMINLSDSDESEYLTAGSNTDLSSSLQNKQFQRRTRFHHHYLDINMIQYEGYSESDNVINQPRLRPRRRKKRRKRKRPIGELSQGVENKCVSDKNGEDIPKCIIENNKNAQEESSTKCEENLTVNTSNKEPVQNTEELHASPTSTKAAYTQAATLPETCDIPIYQQSHKQSQAQNTPNQVQYDVECPLETDSVVINKKSNTLYNSASNDAVIPNLCTSQLKIHERCSSEDKESQTSVYESARTSRENSPSHSCKSSVMCEDIPQGHSPQTSVKCGEFSPGHSCKSSVICEDNPSSNSCKSSVICEDIPQGHSPQTSVTWEGNPPSPTLPPAVIHYENLCSTTTPSPPTSRRSSGSMSPDNPQQQAAGTADHIAQPVTPQTYQDKEPWNETYI